MLTYLILVGAIIAIYYSCELFVNAIEWVGKKFNICQSAIGTILAAFGTALPESVVTFSAVAFHANPEQKDIGIGAALGGPLVLGTIAYAVVGLCIILFRKQRNAGTVLDIDSAKLSRDQQWFVSIFIFKVLLGFFIFTGKALTGFLFLGAYMFYFYKEIMAKCDIVADELQPLTFQPHKAEPAVKWVVAQTLLSLTLIFISSQLFVQNLEAVSVMWNLPPNLVALLLSPIATELPEIINAVIWVRQGKESLALGNISGAMMIQATVPSAFGLFFTPWLFDRNLIAAGLITLASVLYLLFTLKNSRLSMYRLLYAGLFYAAFAVAIMG